MKKILDFSKKIDSKLLKECANSLKNGNLVIFPTETVYGIGANALDSNAVDKIFVAKGRANDNPLIVHISNFNMLTDLVSSISAIEKKLIDAFFPGPFTLILPKKNIIPNNVSANLDTVGIRMPDNKIAHDLIEISNIPIAAPSANVSSKPSGTRVEDIISEFDGKVEYIIDGGQTKIGIESTVVKVIDDIPTILRPGKITPEDIKEVIGIVKISDSIFKKAEGIIESPGMKYKHYAPNSECLLLYSENKEDLKKLINQNIKDNTVIIGCEEFKNDYDNYLSYGKYNDYDEISHNIFFLLRKADNFKPDLIIVMGVRKEGLGIAIMNRLIRSSNYNYIER